MFFNHLAKKIMLICGIDEVGRGCLAGPVCSAAVVFKTPDIDLELKDSKLLTAKRRHELDLEIRQVAWFGIGLATVEEIDELNILQATFLSMRRAVDELERQVRPAKYFIDGRDRIPNFGDRQQKPVIGGDRSVAEISAASIVAKVYRDNLMIELDQLFPQYSFCKHKGYGTATHVKAISSFGILEAHRKSFAPIKNWQSTPAK